MYVGDDWYRIENRSIMKRIYQRRNKTIYFPYTKVISSTKRPEALNVVRKYDLSDVDRDNKNETVKSGNERDLIYRMICP